MGRRHLRSNNSWMHNSERLTRGKDRCTLLMHPDDAAARDLSDGDAVRVFNALGEVRCNVQVGAWIRPGTVSLPKGLRRRSTPSPTPEAG